MEADVVSQLHLIKMTKWIFVFAIIFLASANDFHDTAINKFPEALERLPLGTFKNLPSGFSALNISSAEESLKEKCDKNGKSESFDNAMMAYEEMQVCIWNVVKAKPTSDSYVVLRKFCRISPQLRYCVSNFTSTIEPCLEKNETETTQVITNITDALLSFICGKDQIESFIAEGGPDCFMDQKEAIHNCLNSSFSKYITKDVYAKYVLSFKVEESECRDLNTFQKCIVTELKKCKKPRPANIIDSLFNFVRKVTPCSKYPPTSTASLFTGNSSFCVLLIIVLHILLSLVYKF